MTPPIHLPAAWRSPSAAGMTLLGFVSLLAFAVLLALAADGACAAPVRARPPARYGPVRTWGATRIQSLDPWPAGKPALVADLPVGRRADEVLSNERTVSRWAHVAQIKPIHRRPTQTSERVARLHWLTEDGFPEVYLLLRAHWDATGREWVKIRIPMRPNGRTGWVERSALGSFHLTHELLVVNRERLRMYLYEHGRLRWSAPVAVGKPSTPTPAGHFWIRERFKIADPQSGYWPYAFGTADYSTLTEWPGGGVVGIHGPYFAPQLIPGRISHGCIRLRTSNDAWLARHLTIGTPLRVI